MALFTTIEDFRQHAPQLHMEYNWDKLARVINQITRKRIWPYISEAEYLVLEAGYLAGNGGAFSHAFSTAYNTSASLDATQEKAVEFLQDAIAHYTMLHLLSIGRVQVSQMGIQQNSSSDGSSQPASYHAIQDTKKVYADMAYEFMDCVLQFMEDNAATFPSWTASDAYTEIKSIFVWKTDILNRYVSAGLSRYTFLSLRSQLEQVQEVQIRGQLGNSLTDGLLTALKANTLTADQTKLVEAIQAWQAPAAMAQALPFFHSILQEGGIYLRSKTDGPNKLTAADSRSIEAMAQQLREQAETAKGYCLKYLEDNAATFPDYAGLEYDLWDGDASQQLPDNWYKRSFRT